MKKTDKEIRGWKEIIIETEEGELLIDITHDNYIAKDGYNIRLVPCEDEISTSDVVEVVKCKDCKHWNAQTKGCKRNPSVEEWRETDFCSYGEKK